MTVHTFLDFADQDPEERDIAYEDLDPDTLFRLALNGDQGAVDHLNGADASDPESS